MIIEDFHGNKESIDMSSEYEIYGSRHRIEQCYLEEATDQRRVALMNLQNGSVILMGIDVFKKIAKKVEE